MARQYSIAEARDNFASVVHEAEEGVEVELTRRGKPVAVLLSFEDYRRLRQRRQGFWEAYKKFRQEFDPAEVGLDVEEVFGDRDRTEGRDFEW